MLNDYVIATPSNRSCSPANPAILNTVTKIGSLTPATLQLSPGVTTSVTPGMLFDLGQLPTVHAYAVREGSLTMCDYMVNNCGDPTNVTPNLNTAIWVPIAGNIVSMRHPVWAGYHQPGAVCHQCKYWSDGRHRAISTARLLRQMPSWRATCSPATRRGGE